MVNSGIMPFGARQTMRYDDSAVRGINGLTLWFRADTLPVMNDGTAVATWPDMSGNGYDVTQATGANQPLYYNNIFNGKPALSFNGTSQYFQNSASNPFTAGAARTIFVFAKCLADASSFICFRSTTPVWSYQMYCNYGSNDGLYFTDGANTSGNAYATGTLGAKADSVLTIRHPGGTGVTPTARFNGVNLTNRVNGTTPSTDSGTTGFLVGKREISSYMNGYIAEIIGYNSSLTDAQCLQVEKYLAAKYMAIAQ
jgi:hypothetical protein